MKKLLLSVALAGWLAFAGQAQAQFINSQSGTSYTFVNTDCGKIVKLTNGSSVTATLPQPSSPSGGGSGSGQFMPPCAITMVYGGGGSLTVKATSSTIVSASQITLTPTATYPQISLTVTSDGANWQVPNINFQSTY